MKTIFAVLKQKIYGYGWLRLNKAIDGSGAYSSKQKEFVLKYSRPVITAVFYVGAIIVFFRIYERLGFQKVVALLLFVMILRGGIK